MSRHRRDSISAQIAALATQLHDVSGLDRTCEALERGGLTASSGVTTRASVAGGNAALERVLGRLVNVWSSARELFTGPALAITLRSAVAAAATERLRA